MEVAKKLISVHAFEINKRKARAQLSQLLLKLVKCRALTIKEVAELMYVSV